MIKFERKGSSAQLVVEIDVPLLGVRVWTLDLMTMQYEWQAGFWVKAAREQLWQRIRAIREAAYERGWKDAKSKKRAKETWFSGSLED